MSAAVLRELFEQKTRALSLHPSLGKLSVQAYVKLVGELACEARRGDRVTRVDMPFEQGGTDSAPTPGDLMRVSLGACMAVGYRTWAARLGVPLENVEVDVTCEFDVRGQLGLDDGVPAGWQRLLFEVRITSDAPREDVERVVEQADRLSPMLSNLSPAIARVHALVLAPSH
jgi:uncharacterized OsmC-like protein